MNKCWWTVAVIAVLFSGGEAQAGGMVTWATAEMPVFAGGAPMSPVNQGFVPDSTQALFSNTLPTGDWTLASARDVQATAWDVQGAGRSLGLRNDRSHRARVPRPGQLGFHCQSVRGVYSSVSREKPLLATRGA